MTAKHWTTATAERTRRSVRQILAARARKGSPAEALRFAVAQVLLLESDPGELKQLVRFFYAVHALARHAESGGLDERHVALIVAHARAVLEAHGVVAGDSKLGHLHGELDGLVARLDAARGDAWSAAARRLSAVDAVKRSAAAETGAFKLDWGLSLLRLGDAHAALRALEDAEHGGLGAEDAARLQVARVRALRLSGALPDAREALARADATEPRLAWEHLLISCHGKPDLRSLAAAVRQGAPHYAPDCIATAMLYHLAHDRLIDRAAVPRIETLLRRRDLDWPYGGALLALVRELDRLETARAARAEVEPEAVLATLERARELPDVEHELLAYAAAARLLARLQAFAPAAMVARRYRAASWTLTRTASDDVLGVLGSLLQRRWFLEAEEPRGEAAAMVDSDAC